MDNELIKSKLDELDRILYGVNSFISLRYIGLKEELTMENACMINEILADAIKEVREIKEEIE